LYLPHGVWVGLSLIKMMKSHAVNGRKLHFN
jgi:hypothetical protein